jgi:hypothetical protein
MEPFRNLQKLQAVPGRTERAPRVRQWLDEMFDGKILLADGFDEALLGCSYSPGRGHIAVYEAEKCLDILESQGMSPEDAMEFFELNVEGSGMGNGTPVFLHRPPEEDEE